MRVLVISRSAWRNDNSTGNTLSDFFSEFRDAEFSSLCMREQPPRNGIAKRHFYISEGQMLRRLMGKKVAVGAEHSCEEAFDTGNADAEKAMYDAAKRHPIMLLYAAREILWDIGGWKNENLERYIRQIEPDVIFFPTFGCYYPHKILQYLHTITDAGIVLFHADDHYTLKQWSFSPFFWCYRLGLRKWMRRTAKIADLQYCISDIQKEDYDRAFGCECKVLTKFADFAGEPPCKDAYGFPLQFVFTGNININRWKSLGMLANVLKRINQNGIVAQLRIYTATPVTKKMEKALNIAGTSFLMGRVSSEEVRRIQVEADVLVHAEATDLKNRLAVRQSFSTKIVDYLKVARPIVAVGSKKVASIKHLMDHEAAIVADNEQELFEKLVSLLQDSQLLRDYSVQAYMCGRDYHDKKRQKTMLEQDLCRLAQL